MFAFDDAPTYAFDSFRVDASRRRLYRAGKAMAITPKAFTVLLVLIERHGEIVSKDDLMEAVWGRTSVGENSLARNISTLRKALDERPDQHRYIVTVPGRGYLFVARVTESPRAQDASFPRPPESSHFPVAIMPFDYPLDEPALRRSSEDLNQGLIRRLSRLPRLRIMAHSTVSRYAGKKWNVTAVGRELDVAVMLTGRAARRGSRVVLSVELVDVTRGWQLWGEEYEVAVSDLGAVEAEIARCVAWRLWLSPEAETRPLVDAALGHAEADRLYQTARYLLDRRTGSGIQQSIRLLEQAVTLDPSFALAHAGLADAYTLAGSGGYSDLSPIAAAQKARHWAQTALGLDSTLAHAHKALAIVEYRFDWDFKAAERSFRRALDLAPHDAGTIHRFAMFLGTTARHREALGAIERALRIDPLSLIINAARGRLLHFAGRFDEALRQYRKTLELDPSFGEGRFGMGITYLEQRRVDDAIVAFQDAIELSGQRGNLAGSLAAAYAFANRGDEARQIVAENDLPSSEVALISLALGEPDRTLDFLEEAYRERDSGMLYLAADPAMHSISNESRYRVLLERVGFDLSA